MYTIIYKLCRQRLSQGHYQTAVILLIHAANDRASQHASSLDAHQLGGRPGSLLNGSGMNAAAAALDCSTDGILSDIMGDEGLMDPNLLLSGDADPTDASFLGVDSLGMDQFKGPKLSHIKDMNDGSV